MLYFFKLRGDCILQHIQHTIREIESNTVTQMPSHKHCHTNTVTQPLSHKCCHTNAVTWRLRVATSHSHLVLVGISVNLRLVCEPNLLLAISLRCRHSSSARFSCCCFTLTNSFFTWRTTGGYRLAAVTTDRQQVTVDRQQ